MEQLIPIITSKIISLWPFLYFLLKIARVLAIILSVVFLVGIIVLLKKNNYLTYRYFEGLSEMFLRKPYSGIRIGKEWKDIVKRAKSENEEERRLAVSDADEVLEESLSKIGFAGKNLQEKLANVSEDIFPTAEEIKRVNQKKNEIIYNTDKELSKEDAVNIVETYEKTIRELQLL